ncbi:hypothetical protein BDZ97DRAFT_1918250 [Flammula alnicola]|nr:hypothetical protein BDZ97DRAFT_1918250 [Flammula alnicola]
MTRTSPLALLDYPVEILMEIFATSGETAVSTSLCRSISEIVYRIPSLWTSIRLGPQQFTPEGCNFLQIRLARARNLPLSVSVHWHADEGDFTKAKIPKNGLWEVLAQHRLQFRSLDIDTDTSTRAALILRHLLTPVGAKFPHLHKLVICTEPAPVVPCGRVLLNQRRTYVDPAEILQDAIASNTFPSLHTLVLPLPDCLPEDLQKPLSHLQTLALDGTGFWAGIGLHFSCTIPFLWQTPHIKTFWFKSPEQESEPDRYTDFTNRLPIPLTALTSLAVTVPGIGLDLLHFLDVPSLENLHLDGSREEDDDEDGWIESYSPLVATGLEKLARHAPNLRRLALTEAHLSRTTWE